MAETEIPAIPRIPDLRPLIEKLREAQNDNAFGFIARRAAAAHNLLLALDQTTALVGPWLVQYGEQEQTYAKACDAGIEEQEPAYEQWEDYVMDNHDGFVDLAARLVYPPEDPRYGHCDECGAPCDADGCIAVRAHETSYDPLGDTSPEFPNADGSLPD